MNNAAYLGLDDELGRVEAGYRADLVLLERNSLEHVDALRVAVKREETSNGR